MSLTTGKIAKLANVAPRTVSKWIDGGKLQGYRIPGSQHRRVDAKVFRQFLVDNRMPTEALDIYLKNMEEACL